MKGLLFSRRYILLILILGVLIALFVYVAWRTGPLATTAITTTPAEIRSILPELSGIGTIQARYTYKIGPTIAGRVNHLDVHVGDIVKKGQLLGEMEGVDLDDRIRSQEAALKSAEAMSRQAEAKDSFARSQMERYEQLLASKTTSEEVVSLKRQESAVARTTLESTQEDISRIKSDLEALRALRENLKLIAPVDGLIISRAVEPGTTVIAGELVIEMIDPTSLWVETRFDQINSEGLAAGLPAEIILRSRRGQSFSGHVLRVEPRADAVTEETLAKIVFDSPVTPLPPLGELVEITIQLPKLPAKPTLPNGAIRTINGRHGVWKISGTNLEFIPLNIGRTSLDGLVQIESKLDHDDRYALYSEKLLTENTRVRVVSDIMGSVP